MSFGIIGIKRMKYLMVAEIHAQISETAKILDFGVL